MTTHDTRTGSETAIPADVMEAAFKVCDGLGIYANVVNARPIALAIMAERERCLQAAQTETFERERRLKEALEALYRCGQKQGWQNGAYEAEMEMARIAKGDTGAQP